MAVKLMASIQRWSGMAKDDKPTSANEGSTFIETDSGRSFVWQNGEWTENFADAVSKGNFDSLNSQSRRIAEEQLVRADPLQNMEVGSNYFFSEMR